MYPYVFCGLHLVAEASAFANRTATHANPSSAQYIMRSSSDDQHTPSDHPLLPRHHPEDSVVMDSRSFPMGDCKSWEKQG